VVTEEYDSNSSGSFPHVGVKNKIYLKPPPRSRQVIFLQFSQTTGLRMRVNNEMNYSIAATWMFQEVRINGLQMAYHNLLKNGVY